MTLETLLTSSPLLLLLLLPPLLPLTLNNCVCYTYQRQTPACLASVPWPRLLLCSALPAAAALTLDSSFPCYLIPLLSLLACLSFLLLMPLHCCC